MKDLDNIIKMTPDTFQSYIEKAREEGAAKALEQKDFLVIHKKRFEEILKQYSCKCSCKGKS